MTELDMMDFTTKLADFVRNNLNTDGDNAEALKPVRRRAHRPPKAAYAWSDYKMNDTRNRIWNTASVNSETFKSFLAIYWLDEPPADKVDDGVEEFIDVWRYLGLWMAGEIHRPVGRDNDVGLEEQRFWDEVERVYSSYKARMSQKREAAAGGRN